MNRAMACVTVVLLFVVSVNAAEDEAAIRSRLNAYLDAFNSNEAATVAGFWAEDAVSLNEETGERTIGRDALRADFHDFFAQTPGAKLTGQVEHVRLVRPDVAIAEGEVTLFAPDAEPTASAFTAVLVKEGDAWLIESSQERELPSPETSSDALEQLAWLVGEWQDETDGVEISTAVRWSPNRAFLIRSYHAMYDDGAEFQGTQIIGWDPRGKQFRTWSFNSDGSFGEGVASSSGDAWQVKITQTQSDGTLATATQVITRLDADTLTVEKIGQTLDGVPMPASEPVTVVRTAAADQVPIPGEAAK